ncbi:hypothetical protein MMC22_011153 [Lobaria immixta]|nr:hypothetical protein [Lobaria immixta]
MSGGTANRQEVSEERTQPPFPFLRLPGEIRNEIYRLVLLRQNVITENLNLDHELKVGSQGAGGDGSVQPGEVAVGTIRCDSWRTYTMGYPIAILLTNQQIYREAYGIFQLENMWTIIWFNKTGVGKDMKDHGFPVFSASNLWRHFKFPVLKVTIMFPTLKDQKQSDTLVVATVHLKQVMRALWTAKGASEMEVVIDVQPLRIKNSRCEHCLLQPFFKLRSVKWLVVLGVSEQGYIDDLTLAITTTDGINQTLGELAAGVQRLQQDFDAERWEFAIAKAGKHVVLMADCATAYENRQYGIGSGQCWQWFTN